MSNTNYIRFLFEGHTKERADEMWDALREGEHIGRAMGDYTDLDEQRWHS